MDTSTTNTVNRELGVIDFDKMKELLGTCPKIIAIDFPKVFPFVASQYLPRNTIIISKDLAEKLNLWKEENNESS